MKITVKNPSNLPTIDYRSVKPLQGDLKDLTKENYAKLKSVLETDGFMVPLFLWKDGADFKLVDGHQRLHVLANEQATPYEVPYVEIEAVDEADAKEKLLKISSQYGTITQEGYDTFTAELPQIALADVNFDALQFVDPKDGELGLPEGDKDDLQQITFTLTGAQAGVVYQAIAAGREQIDGSEGNENRNANGLYYACKGYLDNA